MILREYIHVNMLKKIPNGQYRSPESMLDKTNSSPSRFFPSDQDGTHRLTRINISAFKQRKGKFQRTNLLMRFRRQK